MGDVTVAFDTLKAATRLRNAGFDEGKAHALVSTFAEGLVENLATRQDLAPLATKAEIAKLATKEEVAKLATKDEIAKGITYNPTTGCGASGQAGNGSKADTCLLFVGLLLHPLYARGGDGYAGGRRGGYLPAHRSIGGSRELKAAKRQVTIALQFLEYLRDFEWRVRHSENLIERQPPLTRAVHLVCANHDVPIRDLSFTH